MTANLPIGFSLKLPARGVKIASRRRANVWLKAAAKAMSANMDWPDVHKRIQNVAVFGTSHPEMYDR